MQLPPAAGTDDDRYWVPGEPTPDSIPTLDWVAGSISPNNEWLVRRGRSVTNDGPYFFRALAVAATNPRRPVTHTVYAGWSLDGIGQPEPAVLGWLPDSSAVFVYERRLGDGCVFAAGGDPLAKLDVSTGAITALDTLPGEAQLAPTGRWIVAPAEPSQKGGSVAALEFVDAITLERTHLEINVSPLVPDPGWGLGPTNFVWSPSGNLVAATVIARPCSQDVRQGVIVADPVAKQVWNLNEGGPNGMMLRYYWESDQSLTVLESRSIFYRPEDGIADADREVTATTVDARSGVAHEPATRAGIEHEARLVAERFFHYLHVGEYRLAARLYHDDGEQLQHWNPFIDPSDTESLLEWVCGRQILRCLELRDVVSTKVIDPDTVELSLRFREPDGTLFSIGACCGAPTVETPQTEFPCRFSGLDRPEEPYVLCLPPYVP